MKKAIVTTTVNDYFPELCEYTIPNLKRYADKIGADFIRITDRKYPELHPAFEKLQVHEVAKHYDRTILIDADIMVDPKSIDLTEVYDNNEILCCMRYDIVHSSYNLWNITSRKNLDNRFFLKDRRNLGIAGFLIGCSNITYDFFEPISVQKAIEMQNEIYRPAIIDEYVMSLNVAKYSYPIVGVGPSFNFKHLEMTTKNPEDFLDKVREIDLEWR